MISISHAEWFVMRIIWTLRKASSHQIIHVLSQNKGWKPSTTKTLITRLRKKRYIQAHRVKNRFVYTALIGEQQSANIVALNLFKNICPMHAGRAINSLFQHITISKSDVSQLIKTLKRIEPKAPKRVKCNCLSTKKDRTCKN